MGGGGGGGGGLLSGFQRAGNPRPLLWSLFRIKRGESTAAVRFVYADDITSSSSASQSSRLSSRYSMQYISPLFIRDGRRVIINDSMSSTTTQRDRADEEEMQYTVGRDDGPGVHLWRRGGGGWTHPLGPSFISSMTSSNVTRSRMSKETGYSKCSAAGSMLMQCTARPMLSQCVFIVLQYVDCGESSQRASVVSEQRKPDWDRRGKCMCIHDSLLSVGGLQPHLSASCTWTACHPQFQSDAAGEWRASRQFISCCTRELARSRMNRDQDARHLTTQSAPLIRASARQANSSGNFSDIDYRQGISSAMHGIPFAAHLLGR